MKNILTALMIIAGLTQGTAVVADVTFIPKNSNYQNNYHFTSNCIPGKVFRNQGHPLVKCQGPETTITDLAKNTTCKILGAAPTGDACRYIIFKISGATITLN
ncbi:MAG: hypothetical protein H0X26_00850 [Alphaproteobacteria bacterium]|nr:hypothetical protein [Alphaproteobacteria bacterium]